MVDIIKIFIAQMITKMKTLISSVLLICFTSSPLKADENLDIKYPLSSEKFSCKASAAITYWAPYSNGLNILVSRGSSNQSGQVFTPKFTARPGFIVLIGGSTFYDNLDVSLSYTWFSNPTTTRNYQFNSNLFYFSPFLDNSTYFTTLKSQYENDFQIIKGLVERNITSNDSYLARIRGGGIAAWDFQRVNFYGLSKEDENLQESNSLSQNWYGGGPYISADAAWNFIQNLYFFTNAGSALLLSSHKARKRIYELNLTSSNQRIISNTKTNFINIEPMIDIAFGIRGSFFLNDWIVTIEAAWMQQTYFFHNLFPPKDSPMGVLANYSMQGLTATLIMDF